MIKKDLISIFDQMQEAYALHEMIFDEGHKPVDYIFLEGNNKFEEFTGLVFKEIKNKSVLQVLPETDPELIKRYGEVVQTGEPFISKIYVKEAGKHYQVSAFKTGERTFSTLFIDITELEEHKKKLEEESIKKELLLKEYEVVFNATDELMFLVELINNQGTGKEKLIYLRSNRAYHEKTGIPFEKVHKRTTIPMVTLKGMKL